MGFFQDPVGTVEDTAGAAATFAYGGAAASAVGAFVHNLDPNNPHGIFSSVKSDAYQSPGGTAPPTQADVAPAVFSDAAQRQARIRSASTILTSGAGLLDEPTTYSASRSLLGS